LKSEERPTKKNKETLIKSFFKKQLKGKLLRTYPAFQPNIESRREPTKINKEPLNNVSFKKK
jgi:hypothetical protein